LIAEESRKEINNIDGVTKALQKEGTYLYGARNILNTFFKIDFQNRISVYFVRMTSPPILENSCLVLYASQTGNCEHIAKNLTSQLVENGYNAKCIVMDDYDQVLITFISDYLSLDFKSREGLCICFIINR
jgi:sulfite reductase alpha subunit-like flavoprotein